MRAHALHYTTSDMHFTYYVTYYVNAKVCGLSQVVTLSLTQLGYWNHWNINHWVYTYNTGIVQLL